MDARPTTADSKHRYPPQLWSRSTSSLAVPRLSSVRASSIASSLEPSHALLPVHIDLLPVILPQYSSLYQAQLLQYNKLISPGRGRGGGLQTPPLPPLLSTPTVYVGPRTRSSSKVLNKDYSRAKPGTQSCHGNRGAQNTHRGDRALITGTGKEQSSLCRMLPSKKTMGDLTHPLPSRPTAVSTSPANLMAHHQQPHSNSVPSTPHQRVRKYSFESREPSPNANPSHSPRSAYSETNGNLPSLRPLPPRNGGCQYETIPERSQRRMPYSLGGERLEKSDLNKIQAKLSEDGERKLTTDMRELYDRLKPTDAVEIRRQKLVQKLETLLNETWPGHNITVHLFGSSGNMLCSDDSDVDICITTEWKALEAVCMLADLLAKHGMEKVVCVSSAKVPIVKIWDPELGLACDMNVNNTLALENTRMIRTYVEIDDRIRPLAMIIKYWTRRRIINDAAFGGTLSSYTWICMIIAFLQLRKPPVVPALHQKPHQRMRKKEGEMAAFADDLDKLQGFGLGNKSTLGELLFEFFRFYAHEFDFSESVLSVRMGKLMKKTEKKQWHLATNNQLCVEEPFNTIRNLGNTADDTSFRGIHLELRRAFDCIAQGKLEECCEQYQFPKEEERPLFQRPAQAPRPVLVRSASQQHNRGGRGGNSRGVGRQTQKNTHGNNRRASSSTSSSTQYDNSSNHNHISYYQGWPTAMMSSQDAMYMQPETLAQTLSALQLQENNLRFLQYTQNQQYAQQQALAHAQRMQSSNASQQSSTGRSRTNSFDTPTPLTAPIRPDMFYYPMAYHQNQAYYTHPGLSTYPSSPSSRHQATEHGRSSHRTTTATDSGATIPGSSLRSQSQPASRPVPVAQVGAAFSEASHPTNGVANIPARHVNGVLIPSFIPDESTDLEHEVTMTRTPPGEDKYQGYYLNAASPGRRPNGAANGMPAFGDIGSHGSSAGQNRRRLSSDQFQSVIDRIKRTSRSPSPLDHNRAYSGSTSSAPLASVPFPTGNNQPVPESKPLVVNGSAFRPSNVGASRQPSASEDFVTEDPVYENPLHITQGPNGPEPRDPVPATLASAVAHNEPVIVNGSSGAIAPAKVPHQASPICAKDMPAVQSNGNPSLAQFSHVDPELAPRASSSAFSNFVPRQPMNPLIALLDLATRDRIQDSDLQHLSPVYEMRTPSPTVTRKFDLPADQERARSGISASSKYLQQEPPKVKQKSPVNPTSSRNETVTSSNLKVNGLSWENGHTRGAKSESDNSGTNGWQKIPKSRRKGLEGRSKNEAYAQGEQMPKNDFERKGG